MTFTITCGDSRHSTRYGQPGHSDSLGTGTVPIQSLCEACARGRAAESVIDATSTKRSVRIEQGGDVIVREVLVYDGGVIGDRLKRATLATLTSAERTTLRNLLLRLYAAAV